MALQIVLQSQGPLAKVWLAAHYEKRLNKKEIVATSIVKSVEAIVHDALRPDVLRLTSQLLIGVVRIYMRKTKYLLDECNDALASLQTFRTAKANIDLGPETNHNITLPDAVTEGNLLFVPVSTLSGARRASLPARSQDITLPSADVTPLRPRPVDQMEIDFERPLLDFGLSEIEQQRFADGASPEGVLSLAASALPSSPLRVDFEAPPVFETDAPNSSALLFDEIKLSSRKRPLLDERTFIEAAVFSQRLSNAFGARLSGKPKPFELDAPLFEDLAPQIAHVYSQLPKRPRISPPIQAADIPGEQFDPPTFEQFDAPTFELPPQKTYENVEEEDSDAAMDSEIPGYSKSTVSAAKEFVLILGEDTDMTPFLREKPRKEAARLFYELLLLNTRNVLTVVQKSAYGSLFVSAKPEFLEIFAN